MSNFICEEIKLCAHCNKPTRKDLKFCNSSCAAKHNNKNRKMSDESKAKISKKLFGISTSIKGKVLHEGKFVEYDSIINQCEVCSANLTFENRKRRTCSDECLKKCQIEGGKNSAQSRTKRSKDEIKLFQLCQTLELKINSNKIIAEGWDADVSFPDLKIAIF